MYIYRVHILFFVFCANKTENIHYRNVTYLTNIINYDYQPFYLKNIHIFVSEDYAIMINVFRLKLLIYIY